MSLRVPLGAGAAALALAVGLLAVIGNAADPDKNTPEAKTMRDAVLKLAGMLEMKQTDNAKKEGLALSQKKGNTLELVMQTMALRGKNGGVGVGAKPGAITPDGIEAKLINLNRKPMAQKQLDTEAPEIARMGYVTAAVAETAQHLCPVKKPMGNKNPKDWKQWSEDMHKYALALAATAEAKPPNPTKVKDAAAMLNATCSNCHGPFKP